MRSGIVYIEAPLTPTVVDDLAGGLSPLRT
jgi:hypothetical protein